MIDDLSRYRWHVGTPVRRLSHACPVLFRDVGPDATAAFLRGRLPRLSGRSPVVYLRTASWAEPYTDHEAIGRLVLLRPDIIEPWQTEIPHVYVASTHHRPDASLIGFVPGETLLRDAASQLEGVHHPETLREALGGKRHDEAVRETLSRLDDLKVALAQSERTAAPLRKILQSGTPAQREMLYAWMERCSVTEHDLCAAWHHLTRARRAHLIEALLSWGRS